jgi:hypothetical protein
VKAPSTNTFVASATNPDGHVRVHLRSLQTVRARQVCAFFVGVRTAGVCLVHARGAHVQRTLSHTHMHPRTHTHTLLTDTRHNAHGHTHTHVCVCARVCARDTLNLDVTHLDPQFFSPVRTPPPPPPMNEGVCVGGALGARRSVASGRLHSGAQFLHQLPGHMQFLSLCVYGHAESPTNTTV